MKLHHQTVFDTHARHFHKHMAGELGRIFWRGCAFERTLEDGFGGRLLQSIGIGSERGVICSLRPLSLKDARRFSRAWINDV